MVANIESNRSIPFEANLFHIRAVRKAEAMSEILTPEALLFLEELEGAFGESRRELLLHRQERASRISKGEQLDFLSSTKNIRESSWKVAPAPQDLLDRRVEVTGPAEPKMMINALNSGARVFMADLEDSLSPTWENVMAGQRALRAAVLGTLEFHSNDGRDYQLNAERATLVVRPRGLHLEEAGLLFDGCPMSASLVDFGLYFFHNAHDLIANDSGPYFYLPKIESHLEARFWNDVFVFAQDRLGIRQGTIRATVLIETILAAFEMDEILFELREHAAGLNAGRWDYLFSIIKTLGPTAETIFPDRTELTMTVPFMRSYARLLVSTCHRRGAHAIGGMSAFIPSRKDPEVNRVAFAKVREDKEREASDGFDGTWVAHPDLVRVAEEVFSRKFGNRPHQKDVINDDALKFTAENLLPGDLSYLDVTDAGVDLNIEVALEYITHWLLGQGAVAINNLMEDAATAEISRAELWQWVSRRVTTRDMTTLSADEFCARLEQAERKLSQRLPKAKVLLAKDLLSRLVLAPYFEEFLTVPAYRTLLKTEVENA
ncbi:MAG TPA: malate synthase A [Bdellovibrionales bacterium]|nr:malate synthase A [Bdellovibrionales bacterium]